MFVAAAWNLVWISEGGGRREETTLQADVQITGPGQAQETPGCYLAAH